ncbi:hypothetical protein PBOI14_12340 [Pseudomonas sp. Boi14]|nr:hypothetical protein PBOI14_12340 [Pseudomonas sp. Boi14]
MCCAGPPLASRSKHEKQGWRSFRFLSSGGGFAGIRRGAGGYLLAALGSVCLTLLLPLPRADAVVSGMVTSFLFYLVAVLWCFACRSAWQAWLGLLLPSLVLALVAGSAYWVALL